MKKSILGLVMTVALLTGIVLPASGVFAADHAHVTVTGNVAYVAITGTDTWIINGLVAGNSFIETSHTYYSNPLGDEAVPSDPVNVSECEFTVTNASSSVPLDLTVNFADFTGAGTPMQNSDTGSATATDFGAYSYCEGMTYSSGKVVAAVASPAPMKSDWTGSTLKWGLAVSTQTDPWSSGDVQTGDVTIVAAMHI